MYGNVFNYSLLIATIISAVGLAYCVGRIWVCSKPSLAAASTAGVIVGAIIFAGGYLLVVVLSERHLNSPTATNLLGFSFIMASLSASCAHILRRSRRHHSGLGASVLAISFGVISTLAIGVWLGMVLTAFVVGGPQ